MRARESSEDTRLLAFDGTGRLRWSWDREGDGPMEFHRLRDLHPRGDTVVAWDYWRGRVHLFGSKGEWQRGFGLDIEFPSLRIEPLGEGAIVTTVRVPAMLDEERSPGPARTPETVVRMDWTGAVLDTVGVAAGTESVLVAMELGLADKRPFFGHVSEIAVRDDVVLIADGEALGWREVDSTGRTVRIVRAAFDRTLSPELIAAERAVQDSLLPPASVRDLREGVPVPELRPALDRLLVDDRGRVWLREHRGEYMALTGSGPRIWQLFDPSGAWLGRVEVPGTFIVHAIGADLVYGVEADAFGVEHPQARPLLSSLPPNRL